MDIINRYSIMLMIASMPENTNDHAHCYNSLSELRKIQPNHSYEFVYVLIDTQTDLLPDGWEVDWYDSPEDAMDDYHKYLAEKVCHG